MSEIVTIKHCPFCGTFPDLWASTALDGYVRGYTIACDECGFELNDEYSDDVINLWNTRKRVAKDSAK